MFNDTNVFASFSVDNLQAAKKFYGHSLGMDVQEIDGVLQLNNEDGSKVMIYAKDDHEPATYTVLNFPVDNIEEAISNLTRAGVSMEHYGDGDTKTDETGIATHGDIRFAWFKDPAGNTLSLVEGM